jgi:hypothetical protein
MIKSPKRSKYKNVHFRSLEKGLKGFKLSDYSRTIKSKETCLFTPQHREICRRILAKTVREYRCSLNIRFSLIYQEQRNITNSNG